jgi:predicted nucleotidyltransferase
MADVKSPPLPGPTDIPGMTKAMDYDSLKKNPVLGQDVPEKVKKQMDETRKKLDKLKKEFLKKYDFILGMGIIPPQAADRFDEEMALTPEEKKLKPMHLTVVIPEDKFKEIKKIRNEMIIMAKDIKPIIWINVVTPVDLSNYCLDSKFEIIEAIGMSYPLYDKGILGTFRVSQIHKSLCLRKFEKYIYSYVIGGSMVRGEGTKTSDVDAFIIIDDTDVKRMSRLELKEKLRGIIYQYVAEATELAGTKDMAPLHVQVYLLTEFWESVKDASPVIFGVIRDGVPLYDHGGFLPWKLLLRMGKITPTPESIDRFMQMGEKTKEMVNRRLIDAMIDIFWNILSPSQALLMLYGLPPPNVKETVKEMKRIFVDKEKMLEKRYIDILEKIAIHYWKGYEHQKIKEVSGKEIDQLLKDSEDYMKRLKELREQIEKRTQEKTLKELHESVFTLLKNLFGKKSEAELVKSFEKEIVNKARADPKNLKVLNELRAIKKKINSKKRPSVYEIEDVRKNATYLINQIIEYGQRCDIADIRKTQIKLVYKKDKLADLFLTNPYFAIIEGKLMKISDKGVEPAKQEEFENIIAAQKGKPQKMSKEVMKVLKKELGDFEILF